MEGSQGSGSSDEEVEGLSSNTQELFFARNHLKNGNKLVDYDIQNGATLQMVLGSATNMKIHIKGPRLGKRITVDVNHSETVHNVKAKVEDMVGVLINRISLIYVGIELDNSKTLASYNIQTGSTLFAVFHGDDMMRIFVHTPMNGTLEVEVKPLYSIDIVKVLLERIVNIPSHRQRLLFSERVMEDGKVLLHYNVRNGSELRMISVLWFFVETSSGKRIEMVMGSSDTIGAVKSKVQDAEFIPPYKQVLSFCGLQLEDSQTLAYYKIEWGSSLKLEIELNNKIQIFIRTLEGRTRTLNVLNSDSIAHLMEKIKEKERIPENCQNLRLVFCGKVLDNDGSVEEYGIEKMNTLLLRPFIGITELFVYVKTVTGKILPFTLLRSCTVGSLKAKIKEMEKLREQQLELVFMGKLLDDEFSLVSYGIRGGSTLFLGGVDVYIQL